MPRHARWPEYGLVTKYYYADGRRIAMRKIPGGSGSGTVYYLTTDPLGGTALVTDTSATMVSRIRYFPYGRIRTIEGTNPAPTDKLFTGQQRETTDDVYHYGARLYNADIGRMLSADTIVPGPGNPQSLNRYSYVLNNPTTYTDPTGNCPMGSDDVCDWSLTDEGEPTCYSCGGGERASELLEVPSKSFKLDQFIPASGQCQRSLTCGFAGGWTGGSCGPGGTTADINNVQIGGGIPRGGAPSCTATFEGAFWVTVEGDITKLGTKTQLDIGIRLCDSPDACSPVKIIKGGGVKLENGVIVLGFPSAEAIGDYGRRAGQDFARPEAWNPEGYDYSMSLDLDFEPGAVELRFVVDKAGFRPFYWEVDIGEPLLGQYGD